MSETNQETQRKLTIDEKELNSSLLAMAQRERGKRGPQSVLAECAELQQKKSNDYQNPHSRIRQADYYPRGISSILDIIHAKVLRMQSVIEAMENDPHYEPNFESIEDSGKDLVNYASFLVAYCRQEIDGQDKSRDFLNRKIIPKQHGNES